MEWLTAFVEKYDEALSTLKLLEPFPLFQYLMKAYKIKAVNVSALLNSILILAERFKFKPVVFLTGHTFTGTR